MIVARPNYYKRASKECWDEWVDQFGVNGTITICLGNVHKYLYRAGYKDGNSAEQDLAKAEAYLSKIAELLRLDYYFSQKTLDMYEEYCIRLERRRHGKV